MRNIGTREQRANWVVGKRAHHGIFGAAAANDERNARRAKHTRARKLGDHAARANSAARARRASKNFGRNAVDALDELSRRISFGVRRIQAIDVAQNNDAVGVRKARDKRRKRVVVAELNLLDRYRVIFVHDRHGIQFHEAAERVARMQVRISIGGIATREQHERREHAIRRKYLVISRKKRTLPNACRSLHGGHVVGAAQGQAQRFKTARDGARAYDNHTPALAANARHLMRQIGEISAVALSLVVGQRIRADFNNGGLVRLRVCGSFCSHAHHAFTMLIVEFGEDIFGRLGRLELERSTQNANLVAIHCARLEQFLFQAQAIEAML